MSLKQTFLLDERSTYLFYRETHIQAMAVQANSYAPRSNM
jgi:hypothetical protein